MPETPKLPTFLNKRQRNEEHSNVNRRNILLINFEFRKPPRKELKLGELLIKRTKQKKIRFSLDIWYLISRKKKRSSRDLCSAMCVYAFSRRSSAVKQKRIVLDSEPLERKSKIEVFVDWNSEVCCCLRWKQFFLLISFCIPRFWMKSFWGFIVLASAIVKLETAKGAPWSPFIFLRMRVSSVFQSSLWEDLSKLRDLCENVFPECVACLQ